MAYQGVLHSNMRMVYPGEFSGRPQTLGDGRSQFRCRLKNPTSVFGTAPPKPFGVGNVPKHEFSGRLKKRPQVCAGDFRLSTGEGTGYHFHR